jgi:CMP-N-acetylneuraminic acid synthetase
MKKITAVIPVRQGSERIKNKNFKPFGGKSLLEHKINIVKNLPVDDIIVNTDSEYAINIAKKEGVNYHKRDKYFASSQCTNSEFHTHIAEVTNSEYTLIAHVTSPLIKLETYIEAIDIFNNINDDSLISVNCVQDYLWYKGKPLNYSINNDLHSQELPKYYKPTYGIVLFKNSEVIKSKNFICGNPYFYQISNVESIDIDNDLDFEFAEFLYNKENG